MLMLFHILCLLNYVRLVAGPEIPLYLFLRGLHLDALDSCAAFCVQIFLRLKHQALVHPVEYLFQIL
jgi:hypothetical protein